MIAYYENRTSDFSATDCTDGKHQIACAAHLHYHLELVLFFEGNSVGFADTERCKITAGDVFLTFPNQIHRYESAGPERYHIFIINPDLLPELSDLFGENVPDSALVRGAADDPDIRFAAERLIAIKGESGAYADTVRHGYLLVLFGRLLARMTLSAASGESHALKSIVTFCTRHYTSDLSLSMLERELHISKYYISHLFSDKLKISFNDYVNSLRVSYACRYLRNGDTSVTEISALVGFGTLRTFNRAFLRQTGYTPSEYRHADPTEIVPKHTVKPRKEKRK